MTTSQVYKIHPEGCLHLLPEIPANSIDMILTDLPYGTTKSKWDTIINLKRLWVQYERIIKPNGAIVLTASQPFTTALITSNPKMFKYEYLWLKERGQNFVLAKKQFMKAHENVLIFYKKQPTYNPQMTDAPKGNIRKPQRHTEHESSVYGIKKKASKDYDPTKRYPLSYGLYKVGRARDKIHPNQKPLDLIEYLIKTYTNEGDTVHDSCLGSGTTLQACKNLNRNCIGFEISNEWEWNYV